MTATGFALFDTAIGSCAIIWSEQGVAGVQLPEGPEVQTRRRIARRFPGAPEVPPPPALQRVVDDIVALLRGQPRDLATVPLDLDGVPGFHRQVYEVARTVPAGRTISYGEIATRLGEPGAARAVGQALGHNPFPIVVPCHRVVAAGGKIGGFSARGGAETKRRMLVIEGAPGIGAPTLFDGAGG